MKGYFYGVLDENWNKKTWCKIKDQSGKEYFFHKSDLMSSYDYEFVYDGNTCDFDVIDDGRKLKKAVMVCPNPVKDPMDIRRGIYAIMVKGDDCYEFVKPIKLYESVKLHELKKKVKRLNKSSESHHRIAKVVTYKKDGKMYIKDVGAGSKDKKK